MKLADRLAAGGFTAEQAHTFASALAETAVGAELVTKTDLDGLEIAIKRDMEVLATALRREMELLEQRLTIRLGGMLVVAVGVILAAIRYLPPH